MHPQTLLAKRTFAFGPIKSRTAINAAIIGLIIGISLSVWLFFYRPHEASAKDRLRHAIHLAELDNWSAAEPEFSRAETLFTAEGDERNRLYAHCGKLIGTMEQRSVLTTLDEIQTTLDHNPVVRSDSDLKFFWLIAKGFADGELQSPAMKQDWETIKVLSHELHNSKWEYRALAQLAIAAYQEGDVQTAMTDVGMAVSGAAKALDSGALMRFLTLIGQAYSDGGKYSQALPYLDAALALAAVTPEAGYRFLTNEAKTNTLIGLSHLSEATRLANEIRSRAVQNGRREHEAIALELLGTIADTTHDDHAALSYLQESARLSKAVGAVRQLADSQSLMADIYRRTNDLPNAEHFAALAAAGTQAAGDFGYLPQRLNQLAKLKTARGNYLEADRIYRDAESFVDLMIAGSSSILAKRFLTHFSSNLYSEHFALVADHLNDKPKAFGIIEQLRGRITADILAFGSATSKDAIAVERHISEVQLHLISARTTDEFNQLRDELFLSEQSRLAIPEINILPTGRTSEVDITAIQKSLGPHAVLLEYVLSNPRSYCLVIAQRAVSIAPLAGLGTIESVSTNYIKAVKAREQGAAEARELYILLIQPVAPLIKRKGLTVIVRDGPLHLLPFDSFIEPSSGLYLAEMTTVVYAPSAATFYLLNKRRHAVLPPSPLLAVGGVPYAGLDMKQFALMDDYGTNRIFDLPNSNNEVMAANAALPSQRNVLLLGRNATESAFKRAALSEFGAIHLAAHGFASDKYPDRAAVILLPDPKAGEDGFLQVSEIVQLHLRAELVVLSACDTAVGPIDGEEGIATLSKAFLVAGASSTVSTLWSISDSSSFALMQQFYTHLSKKEAPPYALAAAKRDMLRTSGHNTPPYYWAAFIFQGAADPGMERK
jgi:CHAT domain-containing protein/tetratricopeptide (TPR) repeat protein